MAASAAAFTAAAADDETLSPFLPAPLFHKLLSSCVPSSRGVAPPSHPLSPAAPPDGRELSFGGGSAASRSGVDASSAKELPKMSAFTGSALLLPSPVSSSPSDVAPRVPAGVAAPRSALKAGPRSALKSLTPSPPEGRRAGPLALKRSGAFAAATASVRAVVVNTVAWAAARAAAASTAATPA